MGDENTNRQAIRSTPTEILAARQWRSRLTALATGYLLFETLTG
ncbi:MAG: hypothetical protein R3C56_34295 [Pirellulaceae bacterium]